MYFYSCYCVNQFSKINNTIVFFKFNQNKLFYFHRENSLCCYFLSENLLQICSIKYVNVLNTVRKVWFVHRKPVLFIRHEEVTICLRFIILHLRFCTLNELGSQSIMQYYYVCSIL